MPRTNPQRYSDPIRGTRTKEETGRLFGCSPTQIGKKMDNREIDFVQVGNRRLPTVASIERALGRSIFELEAPLRTGGRAGRTRGDTAIA